MPTIQKVKTIVKGRQAIVLSGGSIRGAFQAGALMALLKHGSKPDMLHCISAGALNGAFIASEAGKMGKGLNWEKVGRNLRDLWLNDIQEPKDLLRERNRLLILANALIRNFKGLIDVKPLVKFLQKHINEKHLSSSPIKLLIGAVNLMNGEIEYKTNKDENILDFILASASMPVVFPPVKLNGNLYYDGGIRDVAPLRHVIKEGVDEIIIILTHGESMGPSVLDKTINPKNAFDLTERFVDIILNEVLLNDLAQLKRVNQDLIALNDCLEEKGHHSLKNKRVIRYKIIRPQTSYQASLNKFTQADIHEMVTDGYFQGLQAVYSPFETGVLVVK